jgi:hypothetical protein
MMGRRELIHAHYVYILYPIILREDIKGMRKLVALLTSVVILASLFVGVASASTVLGEVRLVTSSVTLSGDNYGAVTISGQITTPQGGLINKEFSLQVWTEGGALVYSGTASGGQFSFLVETNKMLPQQYTVTATNPDCSITAAKLTLRYAVTLTKALQYTYSATAQEVISGTIRYSSGTAVNNATVELHWLDENGDLDGRISPAGLKTNSSGSFGFIVNGWDGRAGRVALVVDGYIHLTGEVKPINLTLVATPRTDIVHTIASTDIELSVSGGPQSGTRSMVVRLYKGTDLVPANLINQGGDTYQVIQTQPLNSSGNGKLKITSDFAKSTMRAGTYTVVVEGMVSGKKLYEGSTTISVVNPARFTLVNAHQLSEFNVGDNGFTFGTNTGDMRIVEADNDGVVVHGGTFAYTIYVNGTLAKDTNSGQNMEKRTSGRVEVTVSSLANISVRVIAHRVVGSTYTHVYERTFTVPVNGWQVTYSPQTLTVDKSANVSFVVRDKNGNPVNNAQVILRHEDSGQSERKLSPLFANIQNGTYNFTDVSYSKIGAVRVIVATLDYNSSVSHASQIAYVRADFAAGINVVGEKVYTVSSNASTLLVGKAQQLTLTVTEGGVKIIPDAIDYYVDGAKQGTLSRSVVDTNQDGLADAVTVWLTATNTKSIVLRARNASGSRMGEVAISAVAPKLVPTGSTFLTDSITTTVTFKVVDPRTNTTLTDTLELDKGLYIGAMDVRDGSGRVIHGTLSGDAEYTLAIRVSDINAKLASDDGKTPAVAFRIRMGSNTTDVDGAFQVKSATLTSDPTAFIIGVPTNLTLTYRDANAKPLADYAIEVNGMSLGKTNTAGQVVHVVAAGTSTGLTFKADTDVTAKKVELSVTSTFDTESPVITAPATVDTSTATITITDNVRVARLMINNVEINIFPLATVRHVVNLNQGTNTFQVIAMDNNYNVAEKTIVITRGTVPAPPPPVGAKVLTTVINQRGYTVDGVRTDFPPVVYNSNNDSMVPLAMLRALGATTEWDEATKTATLTYGGKVVKITIGQSVAVVNGQTVPLIGASGKPAPAYLVPGRTMIPGRFATENLGFTIEWSPPNTLTITAPQG